MSAGHRCTTAPHGVSAKTIDKYTRDAELLVHVARFNEVNYEYDVPYLAGYNADGTIIYIDRHLPHELKLEEDGHKYAFEPVRFLRVHEAWEKALIDVKGFNYDTAHQAATAIEHRSVLAAGIPIHLYDGRSSKLMKYIKADEHEKLQKVPPDLDLTPYRDDNKQLLAHLLEKMGGNKGKANKADVNYSNDGHPGSHCGPYEKWPAKGQCVHYAGQNQCEKVAGVILPKGWCELWATK